MSLTNLLTPLLYLSLSMVPAQSVNLENKIIPEQIKEEAIKALTFFPELYDTAIEFKFKNNIKKSTMQAQPRFASFFKAKENREYVILISRKIQIDGEEFTMADIPSDVKVGWIGHELGHIMDYRNRTNMGMVIFGLKYLFSPLHIKEVERAADTYAIQHGMGDYILMTKNFILENTHLSEKYKERIRNLYISPEEVMELINKGKVEKETEIVGEEG